MSSSVVEAVLEFLRKNGFKEAESALREEMLEKIYDMGSFHYERFLFSVLPPVKIPSTVRLPELEEGGGDESDRSSKSSRSLSSSSDHDEFISLGSSTSGLCSSEFTNPYGLRSTSQANSEASSETESLSQFGTARDYDLQNDFYWQQDERDEGYFMTPSFADGGGGGFDIFGCESEDKFIMMASETDKQFENPQAVYDQSEGFNSEASTDYLDKPCLFYIAPLKDENEVKVIGSCNSDQNNQLEVDGIEEKLKANELSFQSSKETDLIGLPTVCQYAVESGTKKSLSYSTKKGSSNDLVEGFKGSEKDLMPTEINNDEYVNEKVNGGIIEPKADAKEEGVSDILLYDNLEEDYEIFNLPIIHRKNRTGFEENKDLPIALNTVIAGRYHVREYLGSAAFSKVFQANDLHTGVDVCLKIIKNDKDFFDQSLDEIKLLKLVNKNDPADEHHILRLYDYFYHKEHLFIVCELLRANLYEFQKFNQESGEEAYFTLNRLQAIARQCLEALEYLHSLGIVHCDLKPENILIKSYRRCETKIIDLGSSCFQTDNLCLYVQSRSYRAPEVILGLPYDQKIDLWSLGCILAELSSGKVLFPNDAVPMILARITGMLGPIDLELLMQGQETYKYFTKEYDLYYVNEETNQLEYIIPEQSLLEHHLQVSDAGFIDFVRTLLEINPQRRPAAREALDHPWLLQPY